MASGESGTLCRGLKGIAMRNRISKGQRRCALALAMALALSAGSALAEDDDEDVPLDTKILRQLMKDLGLKRYGEEAIDYRERAPLVVPPSRTLPPPQADASVASNPAWPKDPDEAKRRVEAARKKAIARTAAETMEAEGRPVPPSTLDRGRVASGTTPTAISPTAEESGRPLRPSELGTKKSIFGDMFTSFSDKGEVGEFTGEPPRTELTAPPPGYQTPSAAQPYGIASEKEKQRKKALTVEDRMTGTDR
jgi:hypothetical protein